MSYGMFGYNLLNPGGYDPYGMNMANSLYMMNFYGQLKDSFASDAAKVSKSTGNTAAGSGTTGKAADFQTAFQDAFRKALQESIGLTDDRQNETQQTVSKSGTAGRAAMSNRTASAQGAYQAVSSYGTHPSRFWTSSFARS